MVNTIGNFDDFASYLGIGYGKANCAFCYEALNAMKHTNSKALVVPWTNIIQFYAMGIETPGHDIRAHYICPKCLRNVIAMKQSGGIIKIAYSSEIRFSK